MIPRCLTLLVIGLIYGGPTVAQALPPIASRPPPFRIYDVDRREREMRRLIGQLAGTSPLSRQAADAALGRLDAIARGEHASRARHGGRLVVAEVRKVDAELNALSRRLGLRETPY
jgi:hypothetical protein